MDVIIFAFVAGVLGLLFTLYLALSVMKAPSGDKKMQEIAHAIKEGAMAFLARE
ncbi:sodium/proton-translocating pyrophosphatase, partial [Candidatus Woesearchaeota archaeon]|nr:sodium/proton-translocating pyrophosphatase [Candidatus Woesearchaeota archaeon]